MDADVTDIALAAGVAGLAIAGWMVVRKRGGSAAISLLRSPQRILLVGDSLAVGMTNTFADLALRNGHEFFGKGCPPGSVGGSSCTSVVGSSTAQWARDGWIGSALAAFRPTLVLISLGANDFKGSPASHQAVRAAASKIVEGIKSVGAEAVWIDPLRMPFDDTANARGAWRASGAKVFDSSQLDFKRAPDGIHLSPAGYQGWAEQIWSALGGQHGGVA